MPYKNPRALTVGDLEEKIEKAFLQYGNGSLLMYDARREIHEVIAEVLDNEELRDFYGLAGKGILQVCR